MVTFNGRQYATWAEARTAMVAPIVPPVVADAPELPPGPLPAAPVVARAPAPGKRRSLAEKYRPNRLAQVAGQDRALRQIRLAMEDNGGSAGGMAFWISGESGQGKTTIARCLASTLASADFITEIDAGSVQPGDVDAMADQSAMYGWGKGGKAFILNESHGLRRDTVRRLLVSLERIPSHVTYIFTTTVAGMTSFEDNHIDAGPLLSRCQVVALDADKAAPAFARLAQRVARRENLDGQPIGAYEELVKGKRGNLRAVYQAIAGGVMMD